MKVLIADDNVDFCSTISDIVSDFGYETVMFNDPDSAIECLNEHNREISLALLDIEFGPSVKKDGIRHIGTQSQEISFYSGCNDFGKGFDRNCCESYKAWCC